VKVSTDIAAYQLILHDEMLLNFDSNLKLFPPLRNKAVQKELIKNIKDGTIDAISSNHSPLEIEKKKCSFSKSEFGIIGLETAFSIICSTLKNEINLGKIIELLSINPRKILKIDCPKIEENNLANITLFDPEKKWRFQKSDIQSKSENTPFINHDFTGKIIGIINKGQISIEN